MNQQPTNSLAADTSRRLWLSEPDARTLEGFDELDRQVLDLVRTQTPALIVHRPGTAMLAKIIAQLALAWPTRTFAVAVERIQAARDLGTALIKEIPNTTVVTSRNNPRSVGRVAVGTPYYLDGRISMQNVDFLIVAGASCRRDMRTLIERAKRARVYGTLEFGTELAPSEQDAVRALYGFHEAVVLAHGQPQPPRLVWLSQQGASSIPPGLSPLGTKRLAVWGNPARNQAIVDLARAASEGLPPRCLEGHRQSIGWTQANQPVETIVVVENIEHALVLAKLMPGWPVFTGGRVDLTDMSEVDQELLARQGALAIGFKPCAIVTQAGLESWGQMRFEQPVDERTGGTDVYEQRKRVDAVGQTFPNPWGKLEQARSSTAAQGLQPDAGAARAGRVVRGAETRLFDRINSPGLVIRADGGPGLGGLLDFVLRRGPQLIADVSDARPKLLRDWAQQRRRAYEAIGWFDFGADPVEVRVDRFLQSRNAERRNGGRSR